jgi:hypothetical protein
VFFLILPYDDEWEEEKKKYSKVDEGMILEKSLP